MAGSSKYKVRISFRAQEQLNDLYDFYEDQQLGKGDTLVDNLAISILEIEENPFRWQYARTRNEGIRRGLVKYPPIVILYSVDETNSIVYINTIKDARSNWK